MTRASLRPKPVAKTSPDDDQSEGTKPVAMRHARASSGATDAGGAAPESPGSPQQSKGSMFEGERSCENLCLVHIVAVRAVYSAVEDMQA